MYQQRQIDLKLYQNLYYYFKSFYHVEYTSKKYMQYHFSFDLFMYDFKNIIVMTYYNTAPVPCITGE